MTGSKSSQVDLKSYVALKEFVFVIQSPYLSVRALGTDSNFTSFNAEQTTTNTPHE